jgi:hypothetical protein
MALVFKPVSFYTSVNKERVISSTGNPTLSFFDNWRKITTLVIPQPTCVFMKGVTNTPMPEFILMLTHHDQTVDNALTVCQHVRTLGLRYIGFKDIGLSYEEQKLLVKAIHEGGQEAMLEVVSEREEDELRAAEGACDLGIDYLLGGTHASEVVNILAGTPIRYYPFPGRIIGHPSQLRGSIQEIVTSAQELSALDGVSGLDLLAYRYDGDAESLTRAVVQAVSIPVIAAGSIDSEQKIQSVTRAGVWGFTVGSALFEGSFLDPAFFLSSQITRILALTQTTRII